jgi:glycopeptide antibiotics resistance protein
MVGNVLLFVPLGLFVPLRWPRMRDARRLLTAAALFSLGIEVAQFALGFGRRTSSTDVLLNTVGAALGYLLLGRWRRGRSDVVHPPV